MDKQKGSFALIKQFMALQANGIIATHDLLLGTLIDLFPENYLQLPLRSGYHRQRADILLPPPPWRSAEHECVLPYEKNGDCRHRLIPTPYPNGSLPAASAYIALHLDKNAETAAASLPVK